MDSGILLFCFIQKCNLEGLCKTFDIGIMHDQAQVVLIN